MYFEDLTTYRYHQDGIGKNVKNVGWLKNGKKFNTSERLNTELADKLLDLWDLRVVKTRGFHCCDICGSIAPVQIFNKNGASYLLGTSEFRVFSQVDDTVFAAPDMIIHYILKHKYLPPDAFVHTLLRQ